MDKPRIDELLPYAGGSRYALVMLAAKRARQINAYVNSAGENVFMVDELAPPLFDARGRNLLTLSFEEIVDGKIEYQSPE